MIYFTNARKMLKIFFLKDSTISHQIIELATEISPAKFLNTKLNYVNGYNTIVHRKKTKLPMHWLSKVSRLYKHVMIN